ncbi:glutathione S-transferase family protein [Xylophilus sp.]|uniref:glutathione S-transferase family protein n=1 Tax=Xylophilus sp. TaxID=2653893 RepID=UPI0013B77E58|nr:glutathione S-transferase [Xylophilus sp.]KAF1044628.1 MAG: Glutathione S-transferase GstB [Xylophilus sp.]
MLRIWGRLSSINVRKVVWTAQELGLEVQRTDAGGHFGIVREDEYLAMNPNGLVPVVEDEGYVLWESNVIVRYLAARHGPALPEPLYPEDLRSRFNAERWMDWQQTTLNPAGRDAFLQLVRTPPEQRQAEAIERSVAATEPLLALLDAQLALTPYLAGAQFTMADIPVACEIHRWFSLPRERASLPHLERWFHGLQARAGARGVLDLLLS